MAEALVSGLLSEDTLGPDEIIVSDIDDKRLEALSRSFGVETTTDNRRAAELGKYILLAVKPQNIDQAVKSLGAPLTGDKAIISIAAGITTSRIRDLLGQDLPIVRVMPNTPALVNAGVSAVALPEGMDKEKKEFIQKLMSAAGVVVYVDEDDIDAVTALSGSGPAYFLQFVLELKKAGVDAGLSEETAAVLARQTFIGSAALLEQTGKTEGELIKAVASPGGTTEAALSAFSEMGLSDIVRKAVAAGLARAKALAKT